MRPFAASLAGFHTRARSVGQELQLSNRLSFSTFEHSVSEKSFDLRSCDPNFYFTQLVPTPTPPPRARRSWLPPLKFQVSDENEHPALQPIAERPIFSRQQTPLLPVPFENDVPNHSKRASSFTDSLLTESRPTTRATSSIYSRSTFESDLSRKPSTLSSLSETSHDNLPRSSPDETQFSSYSPSVPAIPPIPARYRLPSYSLRNGGPSQRPRSRPSGPAADLWMYAKMEQQKYCDLKDRGPQTYSSDARPSNVSDVSISKFGMHNRASAPSSAPSSPEKAVLRLNMSRGNTMMSQKSSYESVRKERSSESDGEYEDMCADKKITRNSRTLVKKRQPWDQEPRSERNRLSRVFG